MAILKVENLHKSFGKKEVLKGVSFEMNEGEILSVLGSSGGGKTTLLRCINFLTTATSGKIFVNGECIFDADSPIKPTSKQIRERQLNFGLVFQSFNLFPQYTAMENIVLAPKLLAQERADFKHNKKQIYAEIEQKATELLKKVGLEDKAGYYPCELSGGQQQRVSIARALALTPKVLFFDEPTSALDPELTGEILRVIKDLAEMGTTMVIVTHEIEFARNVSDRIIFIDNGIIVEEGTPEEVIGNPQHIRTREFLSKML